MRDVPRFEINHWASHGKSHRPAENVDPESAGAGKGLEGAAVRARHPPRLIRQQRRDHAPLEIGQIIAPHATTLNQINDALEILFMGSRLN